MSALEIDKELTCKKKRQHKLNRWLRNIRCSTCNVYRVRCVKTTGCTEHKIPRGEADAQADTLKCGWWGTSKRIPGLSTPLHKKARNEWTQGTTALFNQTCPTLTCHTSSLQLSKPTQPDTLLIVRTLIRFRTVSHLISPPWVDFDDTNFDLPLQLKQSCGLFATPNTESWCVWKRSTTSGNTHKPLSGWSLCTADLLIQKLELVWASAGALILSQHVEQRDKKNCFNFSALCRLPDRTNQVTWVWHINSTQDTESLWPV